MSVDTGHYKGDFTRVLRNGSVLSTFPYPVVFKPLSCVCRCVRGCSCKHDTVVKDSESCG